MNGTEYTRVNARVRKAFGLTYRAGRVRQEGGRKGAEGMVILVCVVKGKIYINWLRTEK